MAAAFSEIESSAVRAALDELRRLMSEEAESRMAGLQRLELDFQSLRSERLSAAAEASDEQRASQQRLERAQREIASLSAAVQSLRGVDRLPPFGEGDVGGSGASSSGAGWELAAQRVSSLTERQGLLGERVKALRLELREHVAQEAEQRVEGFQRLERGFEHLRASQASALSFLGGSDAAGSLRGEMLKLSRKQAELLSLSETTTRAQNEWWEKAQQRIGIVEEGLAAVDAGCQVQGRAVEGVSTRMEELARAHNSVVRASADRESALDAAFGELRGEVHAGSERHRALEDRAQGHVNAVEVRELIVQWEEQFQDLQRNVEARCAALGGEVERSEYERQQEARRRLESEQVLREMVAGVDHVYRATGNSPRRYDEGRSSGIGTIMDHSRLSTSTMAKSGSGMASASFGGGMSPPQPRALQFGSGGGGSGFGGGGGLGLGTGLGGGGGGGSGGWR